MLKCVEDSINLLSKALSEKFKDFHGLYLYGLFADGKPHPDEDIEIAAVFDAEDKDKREEIWRIVGKVEADLDVFIDLHPISITELEKDEEYYEQVVIKGIYFKNQKV